jgi:hypothetical protein
LLLFRQEDDGSDWAVIWAAGISGSETQVVDIGVDLGGKKRYVKFVPKSAFKSGVEAHPLLV